MKSYLLLATLLMTSGCVNMPFESIYKSPDVEKFDKKGNSKVVTDSTNFESGVIKAFPDIPIPSTHRIDLEKSVIFTSPTQTVGKVTLNGRGDIDSLYRFFESQMISSGWSLVNAFQSSVSSMYFAKPGRFVAIIIEANGSKGSTVLINVGPE